MNGYSNNPPKLPRRRSKRIASHDTSNDTSTRENEIIYKENDKVEASRKDSMCNGTEEEILRNRFQLSSDVSKQSADAGEFPVRKHLRREPPKKETTFSIQNDQSTGPPRKKKKRPYRTIKFQYLQEADKYRKADKESHSSPRRSRREKRLLYGNLSVSNIERQLFHKPTSVIIESDSEGVDPYEKILSPKHRLPPTKFQYDVTSELPSMLTRRQRRLLSSYLDSDHEEDTSTPLSSTRKRKPSFNEVMKSEDDCGNEDIEANGSQGKKEGEDDNDHEQPEGDGHDIPSTDLSEEEEEEEEGRSYNFRKRQPVTYNPEKLDTRKSSSRPTLGRRRKIGLYTRSHPRSPAYSKVTARFGHRRHIAHQSSGSTSSSGNDSDEQRFKRRKNRSMARGRRRCLPMNITTEDIASSAFATARDRQKIGASLADIDPMNIDRSVTFDSIGGLSEHIQSLKEMIVFPLLYPEVFDKFKISPPRGVLFHGAPGCGKTLVARALANECSKGDRKVSFFMRKGADCLSKWVGESERQLRLLFDQAYQMRPSIIFFDEIDGLAPVRSSKQDQIHSSIVSTLLALMDGLDNRGEIVVIGATNRIDAIDPAFRRPGRFDREFFFPLPSLEDRVRILEIHTKEWKPRLKSSFLTELADHTVGYCGADLKSLCTETALAALRRNFPQIYATSDKLIINTDEIRVHPRDFSQAMQRITPAAQRVEVSLARALSPYLSILLSRSLLQLISRAHFLYPSGWKQLSKASKIYGRALLRRCEGSADERDDGSSPAALPSDAPSTSASHSRAHSKRTFLAPQTHKSVKSSSSFSVATILSSSGPESSPTEDSYGNSHHGNKNIQNERIEAGRQLSSRISNSSLGLGQSVNSYDAFYGQILPDSPEEVYFDTKRLSGKTLFEANDIFEEEPASKGSPQCVSEETDPGTPADCQRGHSSNLLSLMADPHRIPVLFRSRLLIGGEPHMGQSEHLGPALLHSLEGFSHHILDLSALYSVAMRTPEEGCHQVFKEARCSAPSVVYLPSMNLWWPGSSEALRAILKSCLLHLPVDKPIFILATYEGCGLESDTELFDLFDPSQGEVFYVEAPNKEERRTYFQDVVLIQPSLPPLEIPTSENRELQVLPRVEEPQVRQLSEDEKLKLKKRWEATLRELRVFLRDATNKLLAERKFKDFTKPVDPEEVPDYYEVIKYPIDLSTVMKKIDSRCYLTPKEWLGDVDLITKNALEYNPEHDNESCLLRHRACELQDMAHSFLDHELNEDFEKLCMDLKESAETLGLQQLPFYLPATITNRQPVGQVHSHSSSEECSSELVRRSLRQKGMGPLSEGLPYYEKKRASSKKTTSEQEEMATEEEQEDEQSKSNQEKADTGEAMEISEENPYNNEDEPGEKDTNLKEKYYSPQMVTRAAKKRLSANSESEKDSLVVQLPKSAIKSVPAPHSINHASDSHDSYGNDKTVRKEEESGVHNFHLCLSDDVQESDTIAEDNAFLSDETDTARQQTDSRELATQSSLKNDGDISQVTPPAYVDNMEGSPLQATEPKQVLISRNDQFKLLNRIVRRTECANLQTLQKLHSMLRHVVFRYRMTAERYQLTKDMEILLDAFSEDKAL